MLRMFSTFALAVMLTILPIAHTTALAADLHERQELVKFEQTWAKALLHANLRTLEQLYADRLHYVHSDGREQDKRELLSEIGTQAVQYQSIRQDDLEIERYENAALVTSWAQLTILDHEQQKPVTVHLLHVWVLQNGRWRLVAAQATRMIASR